MATKTFGDMFAKVVRQAGLTNTFNDGLEETESIKEDINDIQKQVLSLSKTYLEKAGIVVVGGTVIGQNNYTIPATVDKISLIKVTVDSNDYFPEEVSIQDFNKLANTNSSSDIPVFYTVDKTELYIFPTPETASLVIELNANQYATALETDPSVTTDQSTVLQIKEGLENTIYFYALSEAYSRLEDFASADRYERKFLTMEKKHKEEVRNPTNSIVVKSGGKGTINPNYYSTLTN